MIIDFNNPYQYYFSLLPHEQRFVYETVLDGIREFKDEIPIPQTSKSALSDIWDYIMLDNPLIFYARSYVYMMNVQEMAVAVKPTYELPKQTAKQHTNEIIKHLMKFGSIRTKGEIEKEIFLHDHCVTTLKYDSSIGSNAFTILGPILNKTAVCEGISKYAKLVFDYVGMKSLLVIGELKKPMPGTPEGHAWNIVEVGSKPYHLDVTLDLTMMEKNKRYDYFNLSDRDIQKDHIVFSNTPTCRTDGNDYYSQRSLTFNSFDKLSKHIANCLKVGIKSIVFRMRLNNSNGGIESSIMEIAKREYSAITNASFEIGIRSNADQMVYELHFTP